MGRHLRKDHGGVAMYEGEEQDDWGAKKTWGNGWKGVT